MQSHSHGLSKNHPALTSVPVTFSTSNNMVSQSLESRMKKLKIRPQSPSSVSNDISAGSVNGGVVASPGSKTYRSRVRMDLPWKKEEPTTSHSSVSKYGQAHQSGSNNGGCVTSSNFEMSVAKNSGDSRAGVDEAGRVGGLGGWNKGRRRAKPRRGIDVQSGSSNDPRGGSDDGWRGRKGKRVGSRGERTTTSMTEGVKDQKDIRAHHQYQRKHQYRPYQTQFQPQYRPVDTARVRGYHQVYQEQQQQQQQRYTSGTRTNIVKNSLLLDIQSRSPQSTQLTHLTLLRYEFLLDKFLEMIQLLPSLQVLDLEIISFLPSPQPRSQGQDQPALQLAQNNQKFASMQRVEDHFNQDSDNGCMLVDQDDQAQWESRSRQQSQSNGFSDKESNDRQRSFGNSICRVGSQHQFPKVRSLTFRGTIVVPELLKHFPNLEEFALEETCLPPMTATLHPVFASPGLHNTPSSAKHIGNKSLYASGYSSNLSTMISDLAHSILEGCPRLTRLVLKEPLLVEDSQARDRSQQLTLLVRAVPRLRQFVASKRVVTSCPLLIETLFDYHHAHLCSFQVIDDPSSEAKSYTQPQQPYERQYLQQQRYQEQIQQHHHLNSRQYSELLQQTLQLQQQHREQELDALLWLRAACFRILEGCPMLQIFEVKVPLPLQDLIASVPRWICGSMLTVLRLDIEELTVDGGLDTEEEEVMQMFVKSLFFKGSSSGSESDLPATAAASASQSQTSDSSQRQSSLPSPLYLSSDPLTFGSISAPDVSRTGSDYNSLSGASGSSTLEESGSVSSSNSQQDSISSSRPTLPATSRSSCSDPSMHRETFSSSPDSIMSISPPVFPVPEERAMVEDFGEGIKGAWSSDQSSDQSSGHHLPPPIFSHGKSHTGDQPNHRHCGRRKRLPSPPPPPLPMAARPMTTSSAFQNVHPYFNQIETVGRLVALQFLVEHQLVYLPKLDRFFLGDRMYKVPTRKSC